MKTYRKEKPKVVILAGGAASRFVPFCEQGKPGFKLMGKPLVWYTLKSLADNGFDWVTLVFPPNREDLKKEIEGNFRDLMVNFVVQKNQKVRRMLFWRRLTIGRIKHQ